MKLSKEDFMSKINALVGTENTDENLAIIEDLTDTYNDLESRTVGQEDWKKKYEENDNMWREKYRNRFMTSSADVKEDQIEDVKDDSKSSSITFNDLFKEREGKN